MAQTSSSTAASPSTTSESARGRWTARSDRRPDAAERRATDGAAPSAAPRPTATSWPRPSPRSSPRPATRTTRTRPRRPPARPSIPGTAGSAIGVDVGGSGIKAAAVDLDTGELVSPRHRVPTPQPSAPAAVDRLDRAHGPQDRGRGDPRPRRAGRRRLPGDRHRRRHQERRQRRSGLGRLRRRPRAGARARPAGPPRQRRGRRRRRRDALRRGRRPPGHGVPDHARHGDRFGAVLQRRCSCPTSSSGTWRSAAATPRSGRRPSPASGAGLSWKAWAADLDEHLLAIEKLFSPQLFIIGGGVSKRADQFIPRLTVRAEVIPAALRNDAGIVGAAMAAAEQERSGAADQAPGRGERRRGVPVRPCARSAASASVEPEAIRLSPACSARSSGGFASYAPSCWRIARVTTPSARSAAHRHAEQRALGVDLDLLEREREVPVRQRGVDEVRDARPARELRDAPAGHRVRRHDPVGAGLLELRLGALGVGPRDDEQVRAHRAGAERDEHVVRVRVDRRHEAAGVLDAGRRERRVVRRVPLDDEVAVARRALERCRLDVDDDEALAGVLRARGRPSSRRGRSRTRCSAPAGPRPPRASASPPACRSPHRSRWSRPRCRSTRR